jgi:cytochrome c-type biogenesis protein CcmH/NrfG
MSPGAPVRPSLPLLGLLLSLAGSPALAATDVSPVNLLEQALEAYLEERYDDSVSLFREVLQYDRKNETAQQGLESALRRRAEKLERDREKERPDYVNAMDRLRSILQRVPDHPKAKSLARKIRAKAQKRYAKSKFQSSDWFYNKGVLAYIDGDWFQAAQAWEQVYAFNRDKVSLINEIEQAKTNLAEQQRSERIALYQSVAWDNLKQGNYKEATAAWQEVLNLDPGNAEAQEGIKQAQDAESKDLVKKRQEDVQKLSQRAMDAYIEREYTRSMELWRDLQELDPDNQLAADYIKRIQARSKSSSYSFKVPDYGSTSTPASGYQKGLNLLREERYPEAIETLERYSGRNPDDAKAKEALQGAREKQSELAEKAYKQGLVAYSQGDSAAAIKLWQNTLRINPDYQKARQALIKALSEAKKR